MRRLQRLATDLEVSDPYTHGRSRRVARYASLIASRMGLAPAEVAEIRAAAALHDVGKVNTPIEILHKPGRLTDEEFAIVKRHPVDGARMIGFQVEDKKLASIVRHHHERLDGTGYPDALSVGQIPLGARIIAVADTLDAITSKRPYRAAKAHKVALDILRAEAGTQLDPDAVHAFCSIYFARRPTGALVALTSVANQMLAGLRAGLVGAAPVAGVAAVTAGLGSAALLHSAATQRPSRLLAPLSAAGPRRSVATELGITTHTSSRDRSRCCHLGGVGDRPRRSSSDRLARSGSPTRSLPTRPPSSGGLPSAPGTAPAGTSRGGPAPAPPPRKGLIATAEALAGSSAPSITATVKPANPSSSGVSASATAGTGGTPSVTVSASAGGSQAPSASVSLTPSGPPT